MMFLEKHYFTNEKNYDENSRVYNMLDKRIKPIIRKVQIYNHKSLGKLIKFHDYNGFETLTNYNDKLNFKTIENVKNEYNKIMDFSEIEIFENDSDLNEKKYKEILCLCTIL